MFAEPVGTGAHDNSLTHFALSDNPQL